MFPLSLIFGSVVQLRNLFFDIGFLSSENVGVPVISIGNITSGGTGKTPVTADVVNILRDAGMRPAVISRGYGRVTAGTVIVCDGKTILANARTGGDEPVQLARMTKHAIVIADEVRVRGARLAIEEFKADVIVLDDGFQHRTLQRTKDIVLIDANNPAHETLLLPAGYRREPMSSLKRAGAVVITKVKNTADAAVLLDNAAHDFSGAIFSSEYRPAGISHIFGGVGQSLEILKGHSAVIFSGIAGPERFEESIRSCGVTVKRAFRFPDHHRFERKEIEAIVNAFYTSKADFLLTTEKDAVRLDEFEPLLAALPVSALRMEMVVHQRETWKAYLLDGIVQ
jgi:tetraacyldisaccharide 4'-kinase